MGDRMTLGGGGKFKKLEGSLMKRGNTQDPAALAAYIGRKKYGAKKFSKLSQAGK